VCDRSSRLLTRTVTRDTDPVPASLTTNPGGLE
jgi:hypothetical protein